MKINPAKVFLSLSVGLLFVVAFMPLGTDDPPKKKKEIKKDTIYPQQQRSINIEELEQLNKLFDSLIIKQDTLIKKK